MRTGSLRRRVLAGGLAAVVVVVLALDAIVYLALGAEMGNDLAGRLAEHAALARRLSRVFQPHQLARVLARAGITAKLGGPGLGGPGHPGLAVHAGARWRSEVVHLAHGLTGTVSVPVAGLEHALHQVVLCEALGSVAVLGIALGALAWTTRASLRPLEEIISAAGRIADGQIDERLSPGRADTDLGRLATALDAMLDALAAALERAQVSEAATRRLVGDAAHQLRTPLTGISAVAQTLSTPIGDQDRRRLLAHLARESARMGRLVGNLLCLAKLDQQAPSPRRPCDLAELCRSELGRWAPGRPELGVDIQVVGTERSTTRLRAEGVQEALANLIDNAFRHARTSVHVRVETLHSSTRISVADDGPGLPPGTEDTVFERFVSLDRKGGAGLGLAIARDVARAQGGSLVYEGNAFVLSLPRDQPCGPALAASSPSR